MAYIKQTWKDEVLNGPEQYNITAPGTNINGAKITLSTPITQAGTPVTAERMNKIEQGIFDAHEMFSEGLFLPVLKGLTTAGDPVYTNRGGKYARAGKIVTVSIYLTTSSLGGASGILRVDGLPFPTANSTMIPIAQPGLGTMYGGFGTSFGNGSNTGIIFRKFSGGNTTDADFPSGVFFFVSTFSYITV